MSWKWKPCRTANTPSWVDFQDLGVIANAIAPIATGCSSTSWPPWVRGKREAPRDKRSRLVGSNELYGLGLSLMAQAATKSTPRLAAMAFRDGLMIALLALRPLRRGNFINLTIGEYLVRTGAGWTIILPARSPRTMRNSRSPGLSSSSDRLKPILPSTGRSCKARQSLESPHRRPPLGLFAWLADDRNGLL